MFRRSVSPARPEPLQGIFWVGGNPASSLAVIRCPRGDLGLERDMRSLAFEGVETVVSLLDPDEASWLGLTDEAKLASQAGLQFLSFPIHDHSLPSDPAAFQNFVAGLAERVRNGERIGVHCLGSIGRAPLTTACTLIELGYKAPDALEAVERARRCPVPDTEEQAQWILHYKARA